MMNERFKMNENIIEFAREAGIIGASETTVAPTIVKFAELIVRECAGLCSDPVVILQHWGLDPETK